MPMKIGDHLQVSSPLYACPKLIHPSADSINHFIENGQPLDAIRLACTFNLTHKYPPLTIMSDYVENAKKIAEDILSKESYTLESLVSSISWKGCLIMLIRHMKLNIYIF